MRKDEQGGIPPLELWGGVERTHNRVRDVYFDQLKWSGHDIRHYYEPGAFDLRA